MKAIYVRGSIALAAALTAVSLATLASAQTGGPTVALSSTAPSTTNMSVIPVSANFSQNVQQFGASDVVVTNGTASTFATTTADTGFTFDVAPSSDGTVTVQVPANYATSTASSTGNVASNTLTFTVDRTAPTISGVTVSGLTATGATVNWHTSEPATGQVSFGTSASYSASSTLETSATTTHAATIAGLSASTTYHYSIAATDSAGNSTSTADATFTTAAAPAAPVISNISVNAIGTSTATVSWQTDLASNSKVHYGTSASYGSSAFDATATTSHAVTLHGLAEATLYHFDVSSGNAVGTTTSADMQFVTSSTSSTTPLSVTGVDSVKTNAIADNLYSDGWEWIVHFTVPDSENAFRIRFSDWGNIDHSFPTATNVRIFSPESSNASSEGTAITETSNGYSNWLYLTGDSATSTPGRQIDLYVEVKIPFGVPNGSYTSTYTAQTYPSNATSTAPSN